MAEGGGATERIGIYWQLGGERTLGVVMRPAAAALQLGSLRLWRALHSGAVPRRRRRVSRSRSCNTCTLLLPEPFVTASMQRPIGVAAARRQGIRNRHCDLPASSYIIANIITNNLCPSQRCWTYTQRLSSVFMWQNPLERRIYARTGGYATRLGNSCFTQGTQDLSKHVLCSLFLNPSMKSRPPDPSCTLRK